MTQPPIRLVATVLGAPDPAALARFYLRLLGWELVEEGSGWVFIRPSSGGTGLSFQHEPYFVPPVWPPEPGEQQLIAHLDIAVDDLAAAVAQAVDLGATVADHQPQEHVRVMRDPAGHVFDLFLATDG
jgi:catechol 2,3-dioxygenase-like lactoylglutathione lyase family enzyme